MHLCERIFESRVQSKNIEGVKKDTNRIKCIFFPGSGCASAHPQV